MVFFFVHLSGPGSYSYTSAGGQLKQGPLLTFGGGGVTPGGVNPNPPTTYHFPLTTVPYSSSSGSGNGAAFVHRMPRAGGFWAWMLSPTTIAPSDAAVTITSRRLKPGGM